MPGQILAFTGHIGAGKSTACEYLTSHHHFHEMNFAETLKRGVAKIFGWTEQSMYDPKVKEEMDTYYGFSRRKALQVIGTDAIRNYLGPHTFVKILHKRIDKFLKEFPHSNLCISDVRFENEAEMIRNISGTLVHITMNVASIGELRHSSEKGIVFSEGEDKMIINRGSIKELHEKVKALITH